MGLRREKMRCRCGRRATVVLDRMRLERDAAGDVLYTDRYEIAEILCQYHARQVRGEYLARRAQGRPTPPILFYGLKGQK